MDDVLASDIPKLMKMFPEDTAASVVGDRDVDGWLVTPQRQKRYAAMFAELAHNDEGKVTGAAAKNVLVKSGLG